LVHNYSLNQICKESKEERIKKFNDYLLEFNLIDKDAVITVTEDFN